MALRKLRVGGWWAALSALASVACVDGSAPVPDGTGGSEPAGVETLAAKSDIPTCNASRYGEVYYVRNEDQFYYCDGQRLRTLELTGQPGTSWIVETSAAGAHECPEGG